MERLENAAFKSGVLERLAEQCRRRLPSETCGVLFGTADAAVVRIDGFSVVRNASPRPSSFFAFDPADWVRTYYEARNRGQRIVGYFHSHPDGSVLPSPGDSDGRPLEGTYWIVGVAQENYCIAGYQAAPDGGWLPLRLLPDG
ncbi:M67 family metallopeptidase [Cohnella caldifontis]|uniref:M67 family metallopeptidase n=1 Tax=Cohnella caldifontis TaxID=3027471 RepID=UPI0023EC8305|nr:M67 family metallopeptidase [Cohnella sp. YIM B05605]